MVQTKEETLMRDAAEKREAVGLAQKQLRRGLITLDQFMEIKRRFQRAEFLARRAVKRGTYAQIERDLKKRFPDTYARKT